ncbi:hypothetical protein B0H16DRAFT_1473681 [Mycena metata]|uniref:Uncharacterized protein n=1 Tax=Mycena metata TaxID=1033252 RepID=A0AAD7HKA4_9AGAR|nr:hypothetical protein B0H16DRAFT_1473681 [Mycena metata]
MNNLVLKIGTGKLKLVPNHKICRAMPSEPTPQSADLEANGTLIRRVLLGLQQGLEAEINNGIGTDVIGSKSLDITQCRSISINFSSREIDVCLVLSREIERLDITRSPSIRLGVVFTGFQRQPSYNLVSKQNSASPRSGAFDDRFEDPHNLVRMSSKITYGHAHGCVWIQGLGRERDGRYVPPRGDSTARVGRQGRGGEGHDNKGGCGGRDRGTMRAGIGTARVERIEGAISAATVDRKEGEMRWCGRYGDKRRRGRRERAERAGKGCISRVDLSGVQPGTWVRYSAFAWAIREGTGPGKRVKRWRRSGSFRSGKERQKEGERESAESIQLEARVPRRVISIAQHKGAVEHPPLVHDEKAGGQPVVQLAIVCFRGRSCQRINWSLFLTIISLFGFGFFLAILGSSVRV